MLGSLRFRLPALFLVGIVVSGVIAAAVALALFQNYAHKQLLVKLRREANGLTALYEKQAITAKRHRSADARVRTGAARACHRRQDLLRRRRRLSDAGPTGLRQLPQNSVDWRSGRRARSSSARRGSSGPTWPCSSRFAWRPAASRSVR
jgi:hypothetical protein